MHDTTAASPASALPGPAAASRSILIADRALENISLLLDGLKGGIELRVLDRDEKPVHALRNALGEAGVRAVHLLGHGSPGRMVFPSGILDAVSLTEIPAGIGRGVEVVLYGCRTGGGAPGRALLDAIARHTGAPVRAATHRVGSAAKGGSWRLDARRGRPAEAVAFSEAATARYPHLLDGDPYATVSPLTTSDTSPTLTGTVGNQGSLALYVSVNGTDYRITPTGSTWSLDLPEGVIGPDRLQVDVVVSLFDEIDGIWMEADREALRYDATPAYVTVTSPTLTNDATPTLWGYTEYNSTVTVTVGGATYSLFVPGSPFTPDRAWSLDLGSATPSSGTLSLDTNGPNTVTLQAVDQAGNPSPEETITLTIDTTPPSVSIGTVAGDDRINGVEDDDAVTISGTTTGAEAGRTVTVRIGSVVATGTVAADGTWTASLTAANLAGLSEGTLTITADASDAAGNAATQASRTVLYDRTAPTTTISGIGLSHDTGSLTDDFVTATALQTVTASLSSALQTGETLHGSTDGGTTWTDISAFVTETAIRWTGVTLSGSSSLRFRVADTAGNHGPVASQDYRLDDTAPTVDTAASQVSGGTLTLNFSETVLLPDDPAAKTAGMSVTVAGQTVAITDVTGSGSRTLTLTLATSTTAGQAATFLYDPAATGSGLSDAAGTEAAAISAAVANLLPSPPPPPPPPPPSSDGGSSTTTIGGVPVTTVRSTNADGSTTQTLSVPATATGAAPVIPLVSSGEASLTAQLPAGFGLQVMGSATPQSADVAKAGLKRQLESLTAGTADAGDLAGENSGFLTSLPSTGAVLVQTLTPTVTGAAAPGAPLVISGSASTGGTPTALLIDTRNLPSGTVLQLQNVAFAAVIGNVQVTGGDGSQNVWGDGATQYIVLGADDDTLHGGGGDDFIGSKTGNDALYGDAGNDTVQGGEDNDALFGGGGNDLLLGNMGTDMLLGNMGADTLYGGRDSDTLYGGQDDDALLGDLGDDSLMGDQGSDLVGSGDGADTAAGGGGADVLLGNAGADVLLGNMGADTLYGGLGNDTLYGGRDDDWLFGDLGDDLLFGDIGNDTLTGGTGADLFIFGQRFDPSFGDGHDVIAGFNAAEGDRIQLRGGLTYTLTANGAGEAVIVFSNNDDVTLIGVRRDQVHSGCLLTG
ncbi:MAG TPA: DUF4347 domain-containing protein [Azospirillum sp.]|nr:DUF4347 domain-containing protein [Azospirillum sp.]